MLKLLHISKSFPTKPILDDVSITFEPQRIYALMGANGAGKTTLFNILTGFLKADKGSIVFKNKNIHRILPFRINRLGISRTFQDLRLVTKLTVKENVILAMQDNPTDVWYKALIPLSIYARKTKILADKAEDLLKKYFLADVQHHLAGEISYGQQKLLTLVCCIANGADFLLLDEPVAGINPEYRQKMVGLLHTLRTEGKTIVMIEHNTEFIQAVADTLIFLSEGKLLQYVDFQAFKADARVIESYI